METKVTIYVDATAENVKTAITNIVEFVNKNNFQLKGAMQEGKLDFPSTSKKKVLRNYLTRLSRRMSIKHANQFLHFLYKKIYKLDTALYVDLSEKELKIQAAKKAWKEVQKKADEAHTAYKAEKGDFYKKNK